ncbi:MAG: SBBP repeat-containing protein [Planctomycetes bacterium]|nr:SBBP repeat-containing protein [Planctomycetota bacterium]
MKYDIWVCCVLLALVGGFAQAQPATPEVSPLLRTLDAIPLHIVENRGVHPEAVRYYLPGQDKTVFFGEDGITFVLRGKERGWAVRLAFLERSERMRLRAGALRPALFSYFQGPKENWKTALRSYGEVTYENLWPGIGLVYRAEVGALKYEFRVKPGADPRQIRLGYQGATAVRRGEDGALRLETPVAAFEDAPPVAWTIGTDGDKTPVEVAYAVSGVPGGEPASVGFEVGAYDADRVLVIDPAVFMYCGFIGGNGGDVATCIGVDAQGCAYVGGTFERSPTFPLRVGPIITLPPGRGHGYIAKIDPAGKNLLYCGCFGGNGLTWLEGVAIDAAGCAYLGGYTTDDETSFPVTVGPDLTFNGVYDAYVAKVNATGTALVYCGYLGGSAGDTGEGIAVDASGCAYIAGTTGTDGSFPTTVGPATVPKGGSREAYVGKLDPTGTRWIYCGYIGGTSDDYGVGIAVDSQGCAYVAGNTLSDETTFPVAVGPRLTKWPGNGIMDGFVAKVNPAGTALDYCGYFGGGSLYEQIYGVAVDREGHAYLAGMTGGSAQNLPLTVGPSLQPAGNADAIVAKLLPNGSGFVYCGLIGGAGGEGAQAIAVDAQGNAYVAGHTASTETSFPVKDAPQMVFQGITDGWVAMIDRSGRTLRYCGYIAGAFPEEATAIAVTPSGEAFVAGWTMSGEMSGFPVTVGPDLTHNLGGNDAFVARISFCDLVLGGTGRIGSTMTLVLHASDSPGLPYQVGSSLGTGPIPLGNRQIDLSVDDLLVVTVGDFWPWIFSGYHGVLDSQGQAQAAIRIPSVPALIGVRIHTAFVTLDPPAPWGIRAISDTESFTITS